MAWIAGLLTVLQYIGAGVQIIRLVWQIISEIRKMKDETEVSCVKTELSDIVLGMRETDDKGESRKGRLVALRDRLREKRMG